MAVNQVQSFADEITLGIQNAVKVELDRIIEEEVKNASEAVRRRTRTLAADVAFQMYDRISISSMGRELTIRVMFDDKGKEVAPDAH